MDRARWIVVFAYAVALVVALIVGHRVPYEHPIAVALAADVAATLVIFGFSVAFRNSSFYDAFWSVVPPVIALYWAQRPELVGVNPFRLAIVTALIWLWGARLTWNWNRGWTGLDHEDWRYVDLKEKTGVFYWAGEPRSGIHMAPTLWVFAGMLPVYAVMAAGNGALRSRSTWWPSPSRSARSGWRPGPTRSSSAIATPGPRQGGLPPERAVALVAPPQLPGGDGLLVGALALRPWRPTRPGGGRSWERSRSR